jgi:FkbM family methyltransferase
MAFPDRRVSDSFGAVLAREPVATMTFADLVRRVRHARALESQDWLWRPMRRPYRAILRRVAGTRGVARTVNGMRVVLRAPFDEIANDYEAVPFRAYRNALSEGATVFDIGASFGLYSIAAARDVGAGGQVVAFEPAQATAALLRRHLSLNGVSDRVEILERVVDEESGECEFWEQSTSLGASLARAAASSGQPFVQGELVKTIRAAVSIDDFCAERGLRPDVLKIDVEGAEARVLRGARRFLAAGRGTIVLEVHPWALEQLGDSPAAVLDELRAAHWTPEQLASDGNTVHYLGRAPGS